MGKMSYGDKLRDPRWQRRRLEVLQRDGWKCVCCGATDKPFNIHHKRYVGEPWDAPDDALETLCEDCHGAEHRIAQVTPRIFYLAGRITDHPWRSEISPGLDATSPSGDGMWPVRKGVIDGRHHYSGPYFVAADHDVKVHSSAADSWQERYLFVRLNCSHAIRAADVVFAWIDDYVAFGTLWELGMAEALRKFCFVAGPRSLPELWLPCGDLRIFDSPRQAFDACLQMLAKHPTIAKAS